MLRLKKIMYNQMLIINNVVYYLFMYMYIYCTDAAKVKMNEMKNFEIDCLKEKIQTSTSVMEATGEQFS